MVLHTETCDAELLRLALADRLSPAAEEELAAHLESCAACRDRLETLSGGAAWSGEVREALSSAGWTGDGIATKEPRRTLSQSWRGGDEQAVRAILEPAAGPDELGRLGPYIVEAIVGRGGMGVVLKAFDPALQRHVAVKTLAPGLFASPSARERFLREARSAAAIVNDHVMPIHAVDMSRDVPYIVMPLATGQSLQARLSGGSPLPPADALHVAWQIADGLAAAHARGLIHCDIKPANILLEDGVARVKITDFGLALAGNEGEGVQRVLAGTPQYMSPEQARGEPLDHRSDLFSLGSVLYAMLAGQSPFRSKSTWDVLRNIHDAPPRPLCELNPATPSWLAAIIDKLLAKRPEDRYESAAVVAELLSRCWQHLRHPESVPLPLDLRADKRGGRRWLFAAAAAMLVVAVGAWILRDLVWPLQAARVLPESAAQTSDVVVPPDSGQESVAVDASRPVEPWLDREQDQEVDGLRRTLEGIEAAIDADPFQAD